MVMMSWNGMGLPPHARPGDRQEASGGCMGGLGLFGLVWLGEAAAARVTEVTELS